ncbi:MAG: ParB/RepB/Spo0J family partition protein [Anaerolineae bacterium]|nr:ParB/RepB/Spo0J family partition protein [Anaerolineae bacterium]
MPPSKAKPPIPDILGESEALAALIGGRTDARLISAAVGEVDPNPYNPRQRMDVSELAESMRVHGFIGALDGRRVGERVQLAYGARRLAAARSAGIEKIPVYLHDWDDQTMLVLSLVENVQREDLAPLEAGATVRRMNEELGWSQEEIARRTGKHRSWVRDMLALAEAPEDLRKLVAARPDTSRHVRYLTQVQNEQARMALAEAVREREVTAQQLYKAVQAVEAGVAPEEALVAARLQVVEPRPQPVVEVRPAPPTETARGPQVRAPADVVALLDYIAHRLSRLALADLARAVQQDAGEVRRSLLAVQEQLDRLKAQVPDE